ncbi:MAG TPA: response regulator, partial [Rubricoccaceae bacterium]
SGERAHGIYLTGQLRRLWPRLRVLVVSGHDETVYAEPALAAGARGYLMKHEAAPSLISALTRVLRGEVVLSARMQKALPEALCMTLPAL